MRDIQFMNGEFYHVYNRGVDKRLVYKDNLDRDRFIRSLIAFNDVGRLSTRSLSHMDDPVLSETPYVEIVAYTLLPNHFHLLIRQVADQGVSEFMRRLGTGYTAYFNKRYQRSGRLFQGPFKAKHVSNDSYLLHLSRYIHLNVLDLSHPEWRETEIENWSAAERQLMDYRWSNAHIFLGGKPDGFTNPTPILERLGLAEAYRSFLRAWVVRDPVLVGRIP